MAKVHIGKKIKEIWKQSRLKGTEFASLINKDRQVIYDIFKRETIDSGLLQKISKVLDHDFFIYLSNELPGVKEEKQGYGKKAEHDELKAIKKQLAELEKKYELLEEVHQLTKEKLESIKKKKSKK
ncbi:MAG: helix-turn-helix domain-containing protein [Bacteroidota bacterium]